MRQAHCFALRPSGNASFELPCAQAQKNNKLGRSKKLSFREENALQQGLRLVDDIRGGGNEAELEISLFAINGQIAGDVVRRHGLAGFGGIHDGAAIDFEFAVFEGLNKIVVLGELSEAIRQKDQFAAPNIDLPDIEITVNRG